MQRIIIIFFLVTLISLHYSCKNSSRGSEGFSTEPNYKSSLEEGVDDQGIADGTYSATVEYTNTETNYSSTYTLDVEVENGEVTVIYFPNGGHLDGDHISPAEIDENGHAEIVGENGKSYSVQIDR